MASRFFDYADLTEVNHEVKADSPSGTAHSIAIAAARGEGGHFTARATVGENQAVAGGAIDCFLETISELIGATVDGTTGVRMRVVALRGSSTPFCRSESRPHDTLVAKPASVPQPTVALDTACSQNRPVSPSPIRRMCSRYPCLATAPRPEGLSYPLSRHRCWGSASVGCGRSTTMASRVASNILASWDVGSSNRDAQRTALSIHKQTPLGTSLATIRRVGSN